MKHAIENIPTEYLQKASSLDIALQIETTWSPIRGQERVGGTRTTMDTINCDKIKAIAKKELRRRKK